MAADNYREQQQDLFEAGLMRRLRLAVNIWKIQGNESTAYELINETSIVFRPNIPQNEKEIVEMVRTLYGIVSEQTIFEILNQVTGIDAEVELERLKNEAKEQLGTLPRFEKQEDGEVTDDEQAEESEDPRGS